MKNLWIGAGAAVMLALAALSPNMALAAGHGGGHGGGGHGGSHGGGGFHGGGSFHGGPRPHWNYHHHHFHRHGFRFGRAHFYADDRCRRVPVIVRTIHGPVTTLVRTCGAYY